MTGPISNFPIRYDSQGFVDSFPVDKIVRFSLRSVGHADREVSIIGLAECHDVLYLFTPELLVVFVEKDLRKTTHSP